MGIESYRRADARAPSGCTAPRAVKIAAYRPCNTKVSTLILLVSYSGALGGAERVLLDVAGSLPAETCLACPPGPLARAAERAGVRALTLQSRPLTLRDGAVARGRALASLAGHGRELARLLRDLRPDATVLWGMRPALAWLGVRGRGAVDGAGGRIVIAHHDMLPVGPGIAAGMRAAAARADAVVVNSRVVADDLDPGGGLGSRLSVVYPGVDPPVEAAPWPAGPPVVVVIGALVGWKRVELALEAVALARRSVPSLRLRVVGSALDGAGEMLEARLRARAGEPDLAGAVRFTGAVADAAREAAAAVCLLHCAEREPFGLVVAEALACGRPVVVPGGGGPAEIVDPSCAITYAPSDVAAAAAGLVALASDPVRAQAMGAAGRARVAQLFGRAAMRDGFARAIRPGARRLGTKRAHSERLMPIVTPDGGRASELALVTVSFNSAAALGALLDSVGRHLPGVRAIVVDCGSSDDSVAIARGHPVAVAVDAGANLGFGRGSNLGLAHVVEPVTVFVNPDVELIDGSLRALAAELATAPGDRRLLAPLVLSPDGRRQDTVHPAPGSAAERARLVLAPAVVPAPLGSALAPWRARRPRPVGWAVACALAGRTETLRALGPFSDAIFMYGEDLELGLRAARAGVTTWFWPRARVVHHRAHASAAAYGGEPFELLAAARSQAIAMTLGERAARRDERAQAALFGSRALVKRALGRDRARELAQLGAVRSLRRSRR